MDLIILGIKDFFVDILSKALYGLVQGFLTILYWLERVFKILAGVEPIPGSGTKDSYNILDSVLGDTSTAKLILLFLFIGLAMFVISISVGLIRANTKKDTPGESKKVLATSFKALFFFVFIPTLFVLSVQIIGQILNITSNTIAKTITGSSGETTTTPNNSIANTLFKQMFAARDRAIIRDLNFQCSYSEINDIVSLQFTNTSFQYVIIIVVSAIMFWTLGIATIGLAERIINVVILYLLAPVMIGTSPLDGGQRLNVWKDKVITKLFGAMGNIMSMYIFILVLGIVSDIVENTNATGEDSWILTCVYAVVCIAGAMMCCKGTTLIASLISSNAGQEEGLSTMTTSQLAGQGMKLAGAGIGAAFGAAGGLTKAMANKGLGVNNKSVGGAAAAGGANKLTNLANTAATGGGSTSAQKLAAGGATNNSSGGIRQGLANTANKGGIAGLGAKGIGVALGAGALLTAPIAKGISALKDKAYQNKLNKDSSGNKLSKDDPNRVSMKEARQARLTEKAAKKDTVKQAKTAEQQAKVNRNNSIQNAAKKRGEQQARKITSQQNGAYRKNLAQKADKILSKKQYQGLSNDERRNAKKAIIASLGGGRSNQSLDQKIQAAIKKANNESPLSKVGSSQGGNQ